MLLFSPAKVNLFFKVISKRKDGYHEIASLLSAITLGDSLEIELDSKDHFSVNATTALPLDQRNLVIKARDLFRRKTSIIDPLSIHCDKQIPQQAGLGGGSSNAATVLWGMNQLFNQPLTCNELMEIGVTIGADVPFFFSKGHSLCEGIGEKVYPVDPSDEGSFWIAWPTSIQCPTEKVYKACVVDNERDDIDQLLTSEIPYYNQLEPVSLHLFPELEKIKRQLVQLGFSSVVLTGSGSAFVCKGDAVNPMLNGVEFFSVRVLQRLNNSWYNS